MEEPFEFSAINLLKFAMAGIVAVIVFGAISASVIYLLTTGQNAAVRLVSRILRRR